MKHLELVITGMHCSGCVLNLERKLSSMEGVRKAAVSLADKRAALEIDEQKVCFDDIARAVRELGFDAAPGEGSLEKADDQSEQKTTGIRALVGIGSGIPLLILCLLFPHGMMNSSFYLFLYTTPFFVFVSLPIFRDGWRAVKGKRLSMDVMYAMGTGTAYGASVMATFGLILPGEFLFYDSALLLAAFLMAGRYLEARARSRTGDAVRKLLDLKPDEATVKIGDSEVRKPLEEVEAGALLVVRPGERVPADGVVLEGESYVDESMMTGEPVPSRKTAGDRLMAGTINQDGLLIFSATSVGRDTYLSRVIRLVREAQYIRPAVQRTADRFVVYFIPFVVAIAVLSFLYWYFPAHAGLHFALSIFISVVVVACPCAMGLATPAAVTVGVGRGAELGILIRDGEVFEEAERISHVIFDKTGTLTRGMPHVVDILFFAPDESHVLQMAASLEHNSTHPLAAAIVAKAREKEIALLACEDFMSRQGKGVTGTIGDEPVAAGSHQFMQERGVDVSDKIREHLAALSGAGKTVVLFARGGSIAALFGISDELKSSAITAVKTLEHMSLNVMLLTGDQEESARKIAEQAGISQVAAGLLPHEKADVIRKLQGEGASVVFAGDGINDAVALGAANLGIALRSGSDIAMESGRVVLMRDDLRDVPATIELARKVLSRIRGNLFWAVAYNGLLIPVAAGAFYPLTGILFRPEFCGFAMALSSITVLMLSLRLKTYVPPSRIPPRGH